MAIGGLVTRIGDLEDLVASLFEDEPTHEASCPCGCGGKGGSVSLRESRRPKRRRLVSARALLN